MNKSTKFNGTVYEIGSLIFDLILLNCLWILCSLPLITMGGATAALFYTISKIIKGETTSVFMDYFKGFRENFKIGTILGIFLFVSIGIVFLNINYINDFGNIGKILFPAQVIIGYELLILGIYGFPLIATYNITIMQIVKNSLVIGNRHILVTVICILMLSGLCFITIKWLSLIFISLYALISYHLIYKVFRKYECIKE